MEITTKYSDIDLSLERHPYTNDILLKKETNAVLNSLKLLFRLSKGDLFFDDFDTYINLESLLFEPVDIFTTDMIKDMIREGVRQHEPRFKLDDVKVIPVPHKNLYEVTLYGEIILVQKDVEFNFTLKRIS